MLKKFIYVILLLAVLVAAVYFFQPLKKGKGLDASVKYERVKDWPQLPASLNIGNPAGIGIDTDQNIVVFRRGGRKWPLFGAMPTDTIVGNTVLIIDKDNGKLINSWGDDMFIMPHGLTVDNQNNIWVTDAGFHQVFKFSHDGKLLMKLGQARVSGDDSSHFNRPSDVAVAPDGSFYVSDGYGNNRIVKFSATGKYLFEWGKKGSKQGEFDLPHGIDLDESGNVYVADRENNRVQVFDSSGKFLKELTGNFGNICSVTFAKRKAKLYATDDVNFFKIKHRGSDVIIFDTAGKVQTRFGRSGSYDGAVSWYHDLVVDKDENIYIGNILGNTLQKFKKVSLK